MRNKHINGLEGTEVPSKEELISILQSHDLYYSSDMGRDELWDILVTYFNARDEYITITRDPSQVARRQELLECMQRLKNTLLP